MERARGACVRAKLAIGVVLLLSLMIGVARAALADGAVGMLLTNTTSEVYVDEELVLAAACTPGHTMPVGASPRVVITDEDGVEHLLGETGDVVTVTESTASGVTATIDGTGLVDFVGQSVQVAVRADNGVAALESNSASLFVTRKELFLTGDASVSTDGTAALEAESSESLSERAGLSFAAYVDVDGGGSMPVAADAFVVGEGGESVTLIGERLAAYVGRTVRVVARGTIGGVVVAESEPWGVSVVAATPSRPGTADPSGPGKQTVGSGDASNDGGGPSAKGTGNPVGDKGQSLGGTPVVKGDAPATNDNSPAVVRGTDGPVVVGAPGVVDSTVAVPSISYDVHCRNIGWGAPSGADGSVAGTTGESRRLEALVLRLLCVEDGSVEYCAHLRTLGWDKGWTREGEVCGTTGQSRRLEAVRIRLTGGVAREWSVWYRVHVRTLGWMGWARDGEPAGTAGQSRRAEAVQVVLLPAGEVPEGYDPGQVAFAEGAGVQKG